ncbi:MAG: hypothetical protein J0H92_18195 [Sphingobacteriales bacterium]|nr:hypothetical protein [Sphingobacteriales bacterium]OJW36778.1 MAG: hypothetical protein BGO54_06650 [Sphingobacteriales bacterium 46-32]
MDARETPLYLAVLVAALLVLILVISFACLCIWFQRRTIRSYRKRVWGEMNLLLQERQRISADLHDELGALTAGIRMSLHSIEPASDRDAQTLDRVQVHLHTLLQRMTEIAGDLLPGLLQAKGLSAALQAAIDTYNNQGILRVQLETGPLPGLPEGTSLHIYRITHEIISNTIRHAQAQQLTICLQCTGSQLLLQTSDDGQGFDTEKAFCKKTGRGLGNLINRAALLGGRLILDTAPGRGTRYQLIIPL